MPLPKYFESVPLDKAYRLLNHGPTVLVGSSHGREHNVMAAAWAMALDFFPPKVSVVVDKATLTRQWMESSGQFSLSLPCRAMARQTLSVGSCSARETPDKLQRCGIETFTVPPGEVPLVTGCVGWFLCRIISEPHIQQAYDLFVAEVTSAWADPRVFSDGRWHFDQAPDDLRTLHYVAGGQFYAIGESLQVGEQDSAEGDASVPAPTADD